MTEPPAVWVIRALEGREEDGGIIGIYPRLDAALDALAGWPNMMVVKKAGGWYGIPADSDARPRVWAVISPLTEMG